NRSIAKLGCAPLSASHPRRATLTKRGTLIKPDPIPRLRVWRFHVPIYEYHCDKCGDFELTQKITDAPLKKCPTCRSRVKKLISTTSFQLKGSGWYVTDYARSGSGKS